LIVGKKVKRTGEAALFHEQTGKLTDDTLAICRCLGLEARELYPRSVEAFLSKGITAVDADRRYQEYEESRKRNIELILKESLSANARNSNRKAHSTM